MSYILVAEDESSDAMEVPCEQDHSILLSTLNSLFMGSTGLKYKNPTSGGFRGIRLINGRLQPPEEGWGISSLYYCAFAKDNKRKKSTTPNSKTNSENKSQQKDSAKKRKLTDEEKALKLAQKEEEKNKREEKIKEEKARKEALKEEERVKKEALKEEERVKKEEERTRKEAQREEERKRKETQKEEEKARKESERLRKEALKEEEKQKANEKQEKQKSILINFFIKKSPQESNCRKSVSNAESFANGLFLPFQLSENQTIAPVVRESAKKRFKRQDLDYLIGSQDYNQLYLNSLKSVDYRPLSSNKLDKIEPEIIIESQSENEENPPKKYRVKHLQFHENVRPPYRGTFRKKSTKLKPTKPFNKDTQLFDYEVDSEEEWDEGGPGESLDGSESESVKDDYEIDNDFFVPHGYLSEDENDENEDKIHDMSNDDINGDKELKCGPLLKEQVLMAERNRSFSSLTPIVLGCLWESSPNNYNKYRELLLSYKRTPITSK